MKHFFTSISSISRKFKDYTGTSINNYIIMTRIQKSKYLLLFSDKNIHQIANEVGYYNPSHFSRIF
ncbi:helix-turn-helix transcriptional regulator [uncultured Anaerococcus sp.]|uniref:helix-turn-helix transcriptional regulator n=1 Tax=uncultured Anaerococcus sp. TaxID=293428 RepID=UPI003428E3E7